jgi:hypothetical protein
LLRQPQKLAGARFHTVNRQRHEKGDSCHWESTVNRFFPEIFGPPAMRAKTGRDENQPIRPVRRKIKNLFAPLRKKVCEIFHELGSRNTGHKHYYFCLSYPSFD